MKNRFATCLRGAIFVCLLLPSCIFGQTTFELIVGDTLEHFAGGIVELPDGKFVISGGRRPIFGNPLTGYITTLSQHGTVLSTIKTTDATLQTDIVLHDQHLLLSAYASAINGTEGAIRKMDFSGNSIYHNSSYAGSFGVVYTGLEADIYGGTIGFGSTSGLGVPSAHWARYDSNGVFRWAFLAGMFGLPLTASGGAPLADGGALLAASNLAGANNYDMGLVRVNAQGIPVWAKTLGTPQNDGSSKVMVRDSNFYYLGSTEIAGVQQCFLIKGTIDGNILWAQAYVAPTGQNRHRISCFGIHAGKCWPRGRGKLSRFFADVLA